MVNEGFVWMMDSNHPVSDALQYVDNQKICDCGFLWFGECIWCHLDVQCLVL